jgi:undecaprenyl-diphosphatase
LIALMGIGLANGLVALCNHYFFRTRPFNEISLMPVNLLFYRPTDSSFPSNFEAVLFTIGVAVCTKNKKVGIILLAVALLGGFSRIYVGIHYPLDILGGAVIGLMSSLLAYEFCKIFEPVIIYVLGILRKFNLA